LTPILPILPNKDLRNSFNSKNQRFKNTAAAPNQLMPPLIRTPLTNYYEEKENYFFSIIAYAQALSWFGKFQKYLKKYAKIQGFNTRPNFLL